jgi:alkanesulfonate monooxygenase SsuD/methylene tetrahydromethanopterin reductase-like flavin-dependent oxidoreductase (luciferase family)
MKIGLYIRLLGRPDGDDAAPRWASIRDQAIAAEAAGFDLVVFEDALQYDDDPSPLGVWESVSIVAAVAASTSRIGVGHAVLNNPYRNPAMTAKIATTLDEISGGRYTFGIGLGNTPDDYPLFGFDPEHRYSRFAEAIQIIHTLLREGRVDFEGEFYRAPGAELILRGPRPDGPPIVIAAGKPKAIRLAARYADEWNWWVAGRDSVDGLPALVQELEDACAEVGRDPATLRRSLDLFGVVGPGAEATERVLASGDASEIATSLLGYGELGFDEVRVDVRDQDGRSRTDLIASMADVVSLVHGGRAE